MDDAIVRAYTLVATRHNRGADGILVSPALRQEFLNLCWNGYGLDSGEEVLLNRLMCLRKRGKLPRLGGY